MFCVCEISFVLTLCKYLVAVAGVSVGHGHESSTAKEHETLSTLLIAIDVTILIGGAVCIVLIFVLLKKELTRADSEGRAS